MQGFFIILGSVALNQFNRIVNPLFWFFLSLVSKILFVNSESAVRKINDELIKRGYISSLQAAVHNVPADGIHYILHGWVPVFFYKQIIENYTPNGKVAYIIISFGEYNANYVMGLIDSTMTKIDSHGEKKKSGLKLRVACPVSPYVCVIDDTITPDAPYPTGLFEWQIKLCDQIMSPDTLLCKNRRVQDYIGVLITGPSGVGKSTFCYWLGRQLREQNGADPTVATLQLTCPGLSINKLLLTPTKEAPLILDISEFDVATEYAISGQEAKRDYYTMARNKSTLTETLDRIRDTPYVYAVFSMNTELEEFEKKHPYCTQVGRITHKLKL